MSVLMVPELKDLETGELRPTLGPLVCQFIEQNLVFGPGDLRGMPVVLSDELKALIARMYEVFPPGHLQAGRRCFKRVGLSLPKGTGKTELAAWIAACELHPEAPVRCIGFNEDGRPIGGPVTDPYIPMVSYTEEQTEELAYGTLRVVLSEGPLARDFQIGLERIIRLRGDGVAVPLSAAPNARDGARTSFQIADETHWFTLDRLKAAHQTMLSNIPKRRIADAWSLEVTTAPEPGAGSVAENTMDYAQAVDQGKIKDSRLFFFHRQASDDHDLETENGARAAVIEASGPSKAWRDIEGIVELWRDPTTDRAYWERVWTNRMVQSSQKAFSIPQWDACVNREFKVQDGATIVLGFDGARYNDATSIVATDVESGYQWLMGLWECPTGNAGVDWECPSDDVDSVIDQAFERYDVWRLYADPYWWETNLSIWASKYGPRKVIEWRTNRHRPMAFAIQAYLTAIRSGQVKHDGNDALRSHLANACVSKLDGGRTVRDDEGQKLFTIRKDRSNSPRKIDAAMAAILSWSARSDALAHGATTPTPQWSFGAV